MNPTKFSLVTAVVIACLVIEGNSQLVSGNCSLPCIPCQNNGTCASNIIRQHADGQFFGTCLCPSGYSGVTCETIGGANCSSPCRHSARCAGSACGCGREFTGVDCMVPLCFQQDGGVGQYKTASVNANGTCGSCGDGYEGGEASFCRLPRSQRACNAIAPGSTYTNTLFSAEKQTKWACSSNDPGWVALLEGHSEIIVTCNKPTGWNDTTTKDGECMFEFHRYHRRDLTREELFYCVFDTCRLEARFGNDENELLYSVGTTGRPFHEAHGPAALRYLLFVTAAIVGIAVLFRFPHKSPIVVAGVGVVVFFIILNITVAGPQNENNNKLNQTINLTSSGVNVDLLCDNTPECYCNKDAKSLPNCNIAQFDQLVTGLKTQASLKCNNDTKACKFNHVDLLGGSFDIVMDCVPHDCAYAFPETNQVLEAIDVGDETDYTAVIIVVVVVCVAAAACVVSVVHHFAATASSRREWAALASNADGAFEAEARVSGLEATIVMRGVNYTVSTPFRGSSSRRILKDVAATFSAGQLVAILGPSGSGKSSLLDILCGRDKPGHVEGDVFVVGRSSAGVTIVEDARRFENKDAFRRMLSYAADDDAILPSLTVRQALEFAAKLRQPVFIPDAEKAEIVSSMIETFKLEACADTVIGMNHANDAMRGGLSQGERRRVALALHLIALPRLLVLDEPTGALDAFNARVVVQCLHAATRMLARRHAPKVVAAEDSTSPTMRFVQRDTPATRALSTFHPEFYNYAPIVVMTIHQPSSDMLREFDEVMLCAEGEVLYAGPPCGDSMDAFLASAVELSSQTTSSDPAAGSQGVPALQPRDPDVAVADYLLEVAIQLPEDARRTIADRSRTKALKVVEALMGRSDGDEGADAGVLATVKRQSQFFPLFWTQCRILLVRGWQHTLTSANAMALHFLISGILMLFISFMYEGSDKDIPGTLNKAGAVTFYLLWIAIVNLSSLDLFLAERSTYVFETNSASYSPFAYFCTKILLDYVLLRIIPTLIGGAIVYFPIGMRQEASTFATFLLITSLFSLATAGLCASVAALVPSFGTGLLVNGFFIILFFAFGGFISQAEVIPESIKWIRFLSPFYYAFESIMINDLKGETCFFSPRDQRGQPTVGFAIPLQCEQYLWNLGLELPNYDRDVALLGIWAVGYLVLSFLFLVIFVRGKR